MSIKANRKSQKLFPFVKMAEKHEGVAIQLRIYGKIKVIVQLQLI